MEIDAEIQASMGMKDQTYMDWWEWTSPNGVVHIVPGNHPCATCGRHHA